jgi:ribosomal protein L27
MLTNVLNFIQKRFKMVRCQSYQRPGTSSPYGQSYDDRPHLGLRAISAEYVEAGRLLVRQRKYLAKNLHVTRRKHFKYYPGENVMVRWTTSLAATVSGRVKLTHDVNKEIIYVNVVPEPREELLKEDLYRYRTEHVRDLQENKELIYLRQKMLPHFPRKLVNPPTGAMPDKDRVGGRLAGWNNPLIRDPVEIEPYPFALKGNLLKKHLNGQLIVKDEYLEIQKSDTIQR